YYTISFYSFFAIPESRLQALRDKIQNEWGKDLNIVGRIYIYDQGINAQLSIPEDNVEGLRKWLEDNHTFTGRIPHFNWAIEHRRAFKALHVRVRPLVATDIPLSLETLSCEPEYLQPDEWERELCDLGKDALLVDMRNNYEYRIGRFENAVCPDVDTFREEMTVVRDMCKTRDQPIYMYCTGGIRCSIAGAILKSEGHSNVKTLQGGVVAYGKYVRNNPDKQLSIFRGKNFTFDKRLGEEVTSDILSKCDQCGGECDTFTNCANTSCNLLFVQCSKCAEKHHRTCGT
ncbi:Rhodanese-like protein, partial [Coemansia reversa NRRL 1564]